MHPRGDARGGVARRTRRLQARLTSEKFPSSLNVNQDVNVAMIGHKNSRGSEPSRKGRPFCWQPAVVSAGGAIPGARSDSEDGRTPFAEEVAQMADRQASADRPPVVEAEANSSQLADGGRQLLLPAAAVSPRGGVVAAGPPG